MSTQNRNLVAVAQRECCLLLTYSTLCHGTENNSDLELSKLTRTYVVNLRVRIASTRNVRAVILDSERTGNPDKQVGQRRATGRNRNIWKETQSSAGK